MDDDPTADLFDDEDDLTSPDAPAQDGPDLFGTEPDELLLPPEPAPGDDPDVDVELDEVDEIPVDPEEDVEDEAAAVPQREQLAAPPSSVLPRVREGLEAPAAPLALYRRYRPDTFADVIGQQHVTEPLQRALVNNRVNHAYLFSGPRGCGKTTSARILARCLNCERGPTPTPCGLCQSCRDLARGGNGSIDVIEIDAASHGGVDEARDLRERAFFAPVHSRYKVYIIDEAHMVTPQGFNALLKVVEEPPAHVKFIFATTEPEKVIGTIRSRTHHYPFRLVPPKTLTAYLTTLCETEGANVDATVLPLVVRAGAGSVRDSLSVLDQLLGGSGEEGITYRQATALLGYTPDTLLDEIVDAFAAGDAAGVFACVDKVIDVGQDPRRFAEDLLRRLRDLIIVGAVPDALSSGLVDVAPDQAERLTTQAAGLGAGELTRAAEVMARGLTDMRGTTAPRLHLELMCARVLLPGADVDARGIHARLDRLERRLSITGGPADSAPPAPPPTPASAPRQGPAAQQPRADEEPATTRRPADRPASGRTPIPAPAQAPAASERQPAATAPAAPSRAASEVGGLDTAGVRRMWPQVLDAVRSRRRVTWIILSQNAQVHAFDGAVLTLSVNNAGAGESLGRGGSEDVLREAVLEVLGVAPRLELVVEAASPSPPPTPTPPPTPAPAADARRPADPRPRRDYPATPPSPPPEDDAVAPEFATRAKENIRRMQAGPPARQEEAEPDRSDADLDAPGVGVDDLLKNELGAELIATDDGPPR